MRLLELLKNGKLNIIWEEMSIQELTGQYTEGRGVKQSNGAFFADPIYSEYVSAKRFDKRELRKARHECGETLSEESSGSSNIIYSENTDDSSSYLSNYEDSEFGKDE